MKYIGKVFIITEFLRIDGRYEVKPQGIRRLKKIGRETYLIDNVKITVPSNSFDKWPKKLWEVDLLKKDDEYVVLKKGMEVSAMKAFNPLSADKQSLIHEEMNKRKDRLALPANWLDRAVFYMVLLICGLGLVGILYLLITGFNEIQAELDSIVSVVDTMIL